jgi:hypothetical protein
MASVGRPLRASSQEIAEFEFHSSPVPKLVPAPDRVRKRGDQVEQAPGQAWVVAQPLGLATASPASAMTPSGQRRTS